MCLCITTQRSEYTTQLSVCPPFCDAVTRYLSTHSHFRIYEPEQTAKEGLIWHTEGNKREDSKLFVLLGIIGRGFIPLILKKSHLVLKEGPRKHQNTGFLIRWSQVQDHRQIMSFNNFKTSSLQPEYLPFFNKDHYIGKIAITFMALLYKVLRSEVVRKCDFSIFSKICIETSN